jgi:hypothetical protein
VRAWALEPSRRTTPVLCWRKEQMTANCRAERHMDRVSSVLSVGYGICLAFRGFKCTRYAYHSLQGLQGASARFSCPIIGFILSFLDSDFHKRWMSGRDPRAGVQQQQLRACNNSFFSSFRVGGCDRCPGFQPQSLQWSEDTDCTI